MANTDKEFLIRVKADIRKAVRDLNGLAQEIGATGKAGKKANASIGLMGRNLQFLTRAAGAYLSLRMVTSLVQQADAFNTLQARIANATRETGDYAAVSRQLYDIANRTGVALADTVDVFQRLAQSRQDLGATNEQLLEMTDLVQKLGAISGASGTALSAGLLQFGQGLSAGIFRAEEFNSIVENLPALADAIAKGLGKSRGELRQMVLDGKLLSKDVMAAILRQSQDINTQFAAMPQTVQRSSTALSNAFARLLSTIDRAAEGTGFIADVIGMITRSLDNWADLIGESELDALMRKRAELMVRYQAYAGRVLHGRAARNAGKLRRQIEEIDEQIKALSRAEAEKLDQEQAAAAAAPSPQEQQRIERINKLIDALETEAATVGMTRREVALYKLEQLGASEAELERARAAIEAAEATEQNAASTELARRIYAETRTEMENLAAQLAELDRLYAEGKISFDTYSRAFFDATDQVEEFADGAVKQFDRMEAAIRGWGDQFTNTLADMVTKGKLDFRSLADSIINDLLRIWIYKQITQPILASFGVLHDGGIAGAAGASRAVSPLVFAGARRYHSGGFVGLAPDEEPAILQKGEEVLTRDDPRHRRNLGKGGGQTVKVEIVNQGTPTESRDASARFEGDELVVTVLLDDLRRGGRYSTALASKFNLKR